jgi:hypothetical protein
MPPTLPVKRSRFGVALRHTTSRRSEVWLNPDGSVTTVGALLTSPTSGGRSVGIFRSRTQVTEFILFYERI